MLLFWRNYSQVCIYLFFFIFTILDFIKPTDEPDFVFRVLVTLRCLSVCLQVRTRTGRTRTQNKLTYTSLGNLLPVVDVHIYFQDSEISVLNVYIAN